MTGHKQPILQTTLSTLFVFLVLFAALSSQCSAQRGIVRVARFNSQALGVTKHYLIYLPPSYSRDQERRFPVAYYLHGAGEDETSLISGAFLDFVADSLVSRGMPEVIIVMPDGDLGWYTTWSAPERYAGCAQDSSRYETLEAYCVVRARYDEYIFNDLVQHIDSTYRTLPDRHHRGVAGFSMGATGALNFGFRNPNLFSAVVSHSARTSLLYIGPRPFNGTIRYASDLSEVKPFYQPPSWSHRLVVWGTDTASWWAHDPLRAAATLHSNLPMLMPALNLTIGLQDSLLLVTNRVFHTELVRLGIKHEYQEVPGAHNYEYLRAVEARGLEWLARQIGN